MKRFLVSLTLICAVIGCTIFVVTTRRWKAEYNNMLNGHADIAVITFSGQRMEMRVEDAEILDDLQTALTNVNKGPPKLGVLYTAFIVLKSGVKIRTDFYLFTDQSGFAVADYTHVDAGDPRIVDAEFGSKVSNKTKTLIHTRLIRGKVLRCPVDFQGFHGPWA